MCTVSWSLQSGGYDLFFNRDERRERAEGKPPALYEPVGGDACYIAPIDPERGGSWIFVNEHGLCAAVLNHYGEEGGSASEGEARSRGRLLLDLAGAFDTGEFFHWLQANIRAFRYRPCYLFGIEPGRPPELRLWTGTQLEPCEAGATPFVTTSSYNPAAVRPARRAAFGEYVADPLRPTVEELFAFHRQHHPEAPASSVLMARPDARTVSLTRVSVSPHRIRIDYAPVADIRPPEMGTLERVELCRSEESSPCSHVQAR